MYSNEGNFENIAGTLKIQSVSKVILVKLELFKTVAFLSLIFMFDILTFKFLLFQREIGFICLFRAKSTNENPSH